MPRILRIVCVLVPLLAGVSPVVLAQEDPLAGFTDPAGELARLVPGASEAERSDLIVGRALAAADAPPAVLGTLDDVRLIIPGAPEWNELSAWAAAASQQRVIEALLDATDRRQDRVFALPYGEEAPGDLRESGFWIELDGGKLYAPRFHYFESIERLRALAWIEANRLAASGQGKDAAGVLVAMVRLGRQLCDRAYTEEAALGYRVMLDELEQLRDLVYRNPEMLDQSAARRVIRTLEDRTLAIDRLKFPLARKTAARQAVLDGFKRMGAADPEKLVQVLEASGLPPADPAAQEGYYAQLDAIDAVYANWQLRWPLSPYDIVMKRPSTASTLDPGVLAVVTGVSGDGDALFELRHRVRAALMGTRLGIGVVGHQAKFGDWPKPLVAIRPTFIRTIDPDPYDVKGTDRMWYFVPVRDQDWGPRETPHPHRIRVQFDERGIAKRAAGSRPAPLTDQAALESVKGQIAAITASGIEPRNIDEKLEALDAAGLRALVPAPLAPRIEALTDADHLRPFARAMVLTMLGSPEFAKLKAEYGNTDPRNRRNSRRRGKEESPDTAAMRAVALAQERVGVPLAARLSRELDADSEVLAFTVDLDARDFVLYSVGPDGVADWARESGLDGTDLLYWPSTLTLARRQLGL